KAMGKLTSSANAPSAMIIGAAHSDEVLDWLAEHHFTAILLRPKSMFDEDGAVALGAYDLKIKGLWATDAPGTLGRILNGHRAPPPVIESYNRNSYPSGLYASAIIAKAARAGRKLPDDVINNLRNLPGIEVDPNSFERIGNDVIFRIGIDNVDGQRQWVWARVGTRSSGGTAAPNESLEDKLLKAEASGGGVPPKEPPKNDNKTSQPGEDPKKKNDSGKFAEKAEASGGGVPPKEPPKNDSEAGQPDKDPQRNKKSEESIKDETIKSGEADLVLTRLTENDYAVFAKDRETVRKAETITR
ncbi:MAG: hypothetical protein JO071_02905, partial [Deltaproteobacteria bacterium]|nr:hypothetical protein [Deltaproteobacteria bacterium]